MEWQTANLSYGTSSGAAQSEALAQLSLPMSRDRPLFTTTFTLPAGYVDETGVTHREVELAPVTGFEQELLDSVGSASPASIVTALLSRCLKRLGNLEDVNTSLVRDLLVGDREFLMLKLRELTFGKRLIAVLVCPQQKCLESMDVTLNLDDFAASAAPVNQRVFKLEVEGQGEPGSFEIKFRLPTGADQETAADRFQADAESAVIQLLARTITRVNDNCSIDELTVAALPAYVLKEIEEEMKALAPLMSIELDTACVECRQSFITHLDLTSFFLAELTQSRRILEREVHRIAWHYHWPEREILALTRRKRRRYIELIQAETPAGAD